LVAAPNQTPPTWPSITSNSKTAHKKANALTQSSPTVPTNLEINEFKKDGFVVHTPLAFPRWTQSWLQKSLQRLTLSYPLLTLQLTLT
jgi:hypothetical protein